MIVKNMNRSTRLLTRQALADQKYFALFLGVFLILPSVLPTLVRAQVAATEPAVLADLLKPLIKAHKGDVAVAVRVLDDSDNVTLQWEHRGDAVMPTASLIKLPLMVEAYRQAAAGTISLEDRVELTAEDKVPGSGVLTDHFSPGAAFSLRDCVRLMIRYSDNTATNLVIDRVGLEATARLMSQLEMPETQLHSKVYRRDTSIAPERSELYGLGSTTANDMVELLTRLEQRSLVSQQASDEMLEHLLSCDDKTKIPQLLPAGCKIAHKSGAVNRSRTDAGIVYFDGGKFVLCVLTDNNEDTSWNDDNAAHLLCAKLAREIYDYVRWDQPASAEPERLAVGAFGPLVEALQRTLNQRIASELSIDGDLGPATAAAVTRFQAENQLAATGVVDAATWRALGELMTEAEPVPPPHVINAETLDRAAALDPAAPPAVSAKAWIVTDATTGKLVAEQNSQQRLPCASTTKVLTAYLVLELAASDSTILDEIVTFSKRADDTIGSTAGVRAGERLPVGELLYGLLLPSGNDAAVALAEHFGPRFGTGISTPEQAYSQFVDAMNTKAQELGMLNTHFTNPHGLPDEAHVTSAADLARLASAALKLPRMREIINCRRRGCRLESVDGYHRNVVWKNTNKLLEQEGFHGMKTGTTTAAGACLIALGEFSSKEHIVVILGSTSSDARYIDARNLFAFSWRQ